jgi:hypothetical protein
MAIHNGDWLGLGLPRLAYLDLVGSGSVWVGIVWLGLVWFGLALATAATSAS